MLYYVSNLPMKHLYRSRENRVLAGVFGGLDDYLNVDPVILRLIWVLIAIFTGLVPGILAYLIAALIIPQRPKP